MAYLSGFNAYWQMQLANTDIVKIGGQTSHSETINNALIDITNKSSDDNRVLLEGKGTQQTDLSIDLVVTDDVALTEIKTAVDDGQPRNFYVVRLIDGVVKSSSFTFILTNYTESNAQNDASRVTINLQSTGQFDVGNVLVQFLTSNSEVFRDSFGDRFLVREA